MINCIFVSIVIVSVLFFLCKYLSKEFEKYFFLNKFQTVLQLFKYFLDMSYDIIYQNNIVGYTSNGVRDIPKDEMETIERDFIKQTVSLLGKSNMKQLILFFGDKQCLISHMVYYIRRRILEDEIAKIVEKKTIEGT